LGKKTKGQGASQKKQFSPERTPVKEKPSGQKDRGKKPVLQKLKKPNWPLTGLAGAGMVLTAYLALTVWLGRPPL